MQETVWSLSGKDHLEEEMATHTSILAWEIPWTEEPGELKSMWSQRVWHGGATECAHVHTHTHTHTHSHILPEMRGSRASFKLCCLKVLRIFWRLGLDAHSCWRTRHFLSNSKADCNTALWGWGWGWPYPDDNRKYPSRKKATVKPNVQEEILSELPNSSFSV